MRLQQWRPEWREIAADPVAIQQSASDPNADANPTSNAGANSECRPRGPAGFWRWR
jgi:hypothetical protein